MYMYLQIISHITLEQKKKLKKETKYNNFENKK